MNNYYLFSDNGIVGHVNKNGGRGIIAGGYVIVNSNLKIVHEDSWVEKDKTNNYGEFNALKKGILKARELKIDNLNCFLDSELVCKWITGEYNLKTEELKPLHTETIELIKGFENFNIKWIPRDENLYADYLTAIKLDKYRKTKKDFPDRVKALKQIQDFISKLIEKPTRQNKTRYVGFKDIEIHKPKFIRIVLSSGASIIYDRTSDGYYVGRKSGERFEELLKQDIKFEHHISLQSSKPNNFLLVYESDEKGGDEVIMKLYNRLKLMEVDCFVKRSGSRSMQLVVACECEDLNHGVRTWDYIFNLLGEEDKKFIDTNLRLLKSGQIRGVDSLHLKTYNLSEIIEGKVYTLLTYEYNKKLLVVPNTPLDNKKEVVVNKEPIKLKLISELSSDKQERLFDLASSLVLNERSKSAIYIASKLEDNSSNRKFLKTFISKIKNKKDLSESDLLIKSCAALGRNYGKGFHGDTKTTKKILSILYGYSKEEIITRGLKYNWNEYRSWIEKIKDTKIKERRIKEFEESKKFLEERGLFDYIPDGRNGVLVAQNLMKMEKNGGVSIGNDDWKVKNSGNSDVFIMGTQAEKGYEEFVEELKDLKYKGDTFDCKWNVKDLTDTSHGEFSHKNKGNKEFTHLIYDIETSGDKQEPVLIAAYNPQLKRIVLGSIVKSTDIYNEELGELKPKFQKSNKDGWEIIRCDVLNGWEACFLADCETYVAAAVNSLTRQGDVTPSVLKGLFDNKININIKYVLEILKNKRRSVWVAHNSKFDVNKLNVLNREKLLHIKNNCVTDRTIELNVFGNKHRYKEFSWKVKHKLGNVSIGVFFSASTRKYGLWEKPEIRLQPIQKEADSYVYAVDSLLLAKALQKSNASLGALSKSYNLEVQKSESAYNFKGDEIFRDDENSISESNYLINDVIAGYGVFLKVTKELDVFSDLLEKVGGDSDRIHRHVTSDPYFYRVYSTASISKLFNQMLHAESNEEWKRKSSSMKIYEPIQEIFNSVYSGGRVEIFRKGHFIGKIAYLDFASLYPHTSFLTNVEILQKDMLDKKLKICSDVDIISDKFWSMVERLTLRIKNKQKILKEDFMDTAVVNVKLKNDFRISRKGEIKKGVVDLQTKNKKRMDLVCSSGSNINAAVYDLAYSVIEKLLIDNVKLDEIKKQVEFNKGIMLIPSTFTYYHEDIHTKQYSERNKIKKQMKETDDENEKKNLEDMSQFIKINMNSSYGLTAENVNGKGGQFYSPVLACTITSMARLLNNLIEISCGYFKHKVYYSDTDSMILDESGIEVCDLFTEICELKNELNDGEHITDLFVNSPKEYSYYCNTENYSVKTHGVGARGRKYEPVLDELFRNLIKGKTEEQSINEAVKKASLLRGFNFTHVRATTNTLYVNLSEIVNKKSNKHIGEYNGFKLYSYGKNDLFITDVDRITKGTFGQMFSLGEPKIYLFSVKYGFEEKEMRDIIENIGGIPEEKRKLILERIDEKYSERLFLKNYLNKGEDNIKRTINDDGTTTPYSSIVTEDMNIAFDEDKLSLDGVEYFGFSELPDFDFSSKIEADLSTHYSKAIVSLCKGLSYWLTKSNNGEEEAKKVFDKRNSDLLIPQKKNEVLVPIRMIKVPETEVELIEEVKKQDKSDNKKLKGLFEGIGDNLNIKKDFFDKKTNDLKEDIRDLILTELKPRNVILTQYFNNKKYWFEITSYMSNKHNAMLRVNVIVGNPPKIRYYLWVNPHDTMDNSKQWSATYTDLAMSSEVIEELIKEIFNIGYNNNRKNYYEGIISSFSRGSSYSLQDLKKNNKYFLDICYTLAAGFIVKNSVKHIALKIGRLDTSVNIKGKLKDELADDVIGKITKIFKKERDNFLDKKHGDDEIEKIRSSENMYTSSNGIVSGLVNKKTKISQVIYNKKEQLDYKLMKQSRKKGLSKKAIKEFLDSNKKVKDEQVWRIEIQSYGVNSITKVVKNHAILLRKLERILKIAIREVKRIDMKESEDIRKFNKDILKVNCWLHEYTNEKIPVPPPDLYT